MDFREYINGRNLIKLAIDNSALTADECLYAHSWLDRVEHMLVSGQIALPQAMQSLAELVDIIEPALEPAAAVEPALEPVAPAAFAASRHFRQEELETIIHNAAMQEYFWKVVGRGRYHWIAGVQTMSLERIMNMDRSLSVRRFSYMLHNGIIPDNVFVKCTCGNSRCVRPDHLTTTHARGNHIHGSNP